MVVAEPGEDIPHDEGANLAGVRTVDVHRVPPVGDVAVREVRPVPAQMVPGRTEVVVDDVDDHAEAPGVARVDERLEPVGPPVGVVGSEEVDAVVSPAPLATGLGHREQLDGIHAEFDEVVEVGDGPFEGSWSGECPHVELVEDGRGQVDAAPRPVGPGEGVMVDGARGAVDAVGLPRRARVGEDRASVEAEAVVGPGGHGRVERPPVPMITGHGVALAADDDVDTLGPGSPDGDAGQCRHGQRWRIS